MGRNSVEATKASLIRAVRARLAALTAGVAGFLAVVALRVRPAGFAAFLPGLFVSCVDFGAGFFFAVEEACPAGLVAEPPFVEPLVDCPATGSTIIKMESRPARKREASSVSVVGEDATLISSLYFVLALDVAATNHWRYRKRRKVGRVLPYWTLPESRAFHLVSRPAVRYTRLQTPILRIWHTTPAGS